MSDPSEELRIMTEKYEHFQSLWSSGCDRIKELKEANERLQSSNDLRLDLINLIQSQFERSTEQFKEAEALACVAVAQRDVLALRLDQYEDALQSCSEAGYDVATNALSDDDDDIPSSYTGGRWE